MRNFFRHWQYGIKAKVVDGALVSYVDTGVEPRLVRLDFGRMQGVFLEVIVKDGFYDLMLTGVGAPGAATPVARFEVRAAAEEAAACMRCALLRGARTRGTFCRFFAGTLGIVLAMMVLGLLASTLGGFAMPNASQMMALQGGGMAAAPAVPHQAGEPQSADQFLNGQ